jgi:hypothetical protein
VCPDYDRQRAGEHRGRIEGDRLEVVPLDAKEGNIRGRVASDKVRSSRVAARQDDRDLAIFGERFLGGHDQVGPPDEAARPSALGVHTDKGRCCSGDKIRESAREALKEIG